MGPSLPFRRKSSFPLLCSYRDIMCCHWSLIIYFPSIWHAIFQEWDLPRQLTETRQYPWDYNLKKHKNNLKSVCRTASPFRSISLLIYLNTANLSEVNPTKFNGTYSHYVASTHKSLIIPPEGYWGQHGTGYLLDNAEDSCLKRVIKSYWTSGSRIVRQERYTLNAWCVCGFSLWWGTSSKGF